MVQILFNGQPGPQEVACRHPVNWGWVLYSQVHAGRLGDAEMLTHVQ